MAFASWLFLKDNQSIWVERPYGTTLIIAGPGGKGREQRDFLSEAALDQFQMQLAEQLAADGWFLWGVNRDRRDAQRNAQEPRHEGPERRGTRPRP